MAVAVIHHSIHNIATHKKCQYWCSFKKVLNITFIYILIHITIIIPIIVIIIIMNLINNKMCWQDQKHPRKNARGKHPYTNKSNPNLNPKPKPTSFFWLQAACRRGALQTSPDTSNNIIYFATTSIIKNIVVITMVIKTHSYYYWHNSYWYCYW